MANLQIVRKGALLALVVCMGLSLINDSPIFPLLIALGSLVFVGLFATATVGWRSTLVFIAITAVLSWIAEMVGTHTGILFGAYEYSGALGMKLGQVPALIVIAYFTKLYIALAVARLIIGGETRPRGARLVGLSAAATLIMVGWDVATDPLASSVNGQWVWTEGGNYFGVPLQNFWGWGLLNFVMLTTYLIYDRYISPPRPTDEVVRRSFWGEPLVYWTLTAAPPILKPILGQTPDSYSPLNIVEPSASSPEVAVWSLCLIAVFAMIMPITFALVRLLGADEPLPYADVQSATADGIRNVAREPAVWLMVAAIAAYLVAVFALGLTGGYAPPLPS